MNRTLKFRGKSKNMNQWVFGGILQWNGRFAIIQHGMMLNSIWQMKQIIVREESVGEFTGLFDKEGTEIYTGDIISSEYGNGFVGVVEYEPQAGQYWIRIKKGFLLPKTTYIELHRSEQFGDENGIKLLSHTVVGNKTDHPQLLL